ncbi:host specificity protein J [Pseudomonas soli]|uniref:Phage-related protein, tail component n=1 Tax=Pseudomonas soli TaxID=1306993 RepID=A0A1H9Q527_9PSED|nr:phage tail protein [Pseudomonas soli]SER55550.1 Phage-related protein, tail component [Pseudomonas soli]
MGAALQPAVTGAKGGEKKPKAPYEAPDSLRSTNIAKILLAVGEGDFDGTPTDRDIYLDNTPIMDVSGNVNFPGVKWEWRRGTVEQDYIQGIPAIESETSVGVELRSDQPWTRALSNTQLSAVRLRFSWPRLLQQDPNTGDTNGYTIEYAIDIATDGGAFVEAHRNAVSGKTSNGYQRSVRVDLPAATSGWVIRARRLTPNANTGAIADTMTIAAYTEIIDQKLRYPNTALLYIEFDAEQFQNIPSVTVKCKARRWPVPTNYDPIARTYTGTWDGTFKQAWTNNPAFVTYGLCVEDRFGLGKRIKSWMVDKWEMYRIAQYCDQLVPDGVGGQEPRFLCDMNLQAKAEAWTLLRDLSAIYRGMVYWAQGALFMQADMPRAQDFDYVFTRANVIDGEFTYGGAERSTHYSRALVSYDNPGNNYDTDVIPVTDLALQRRYQDRPIEISAIGCTRASEAQRRGKWALLSNNQDRTVTFKTGMEGRIPLPGHVIPVADELLSGRPNGGRIAAAAGKVVTLDRDTQIKAGDRLIINLPNGSAQGRTVQSVAGRAVTVTTAYSVQPEPELQWAIDADDLAIQLFRVLKTSRTTDGEHEITALEFNPSKFAAIDTGAKLEERPISVIPVTTVPPPASVTLTSDYAIAQGLAVSTMTIAWPAVEGAVAYDVEWRKDSGNWIRLQRTGTASVDVVGIYAGQYLARVRAVSAFDITSTWRSSVLTDLKGKEGTPPAVTFLTATSEIFAIRLKWGLPPGAEDTQRTEIWSNPINDLTSATKLADLAYPQSEHVMSGLAAGAAFFFWARLVDRTGNIGPFFPVPPTAVQGIAQTDPGPILDMISGEIDESMLGEQLKNKIDGLQDQINALDGLKAYDKGEPYEEGQMTVVDGRIYQAIHDVPADPSGANAPPNASFWIDVGQSIESANGLAQQVQTNTAKIEEVDGKVEASASQLSALQAAWRPDSAEGELADALAGWSSKARLAREQMVRASETEALARSSETLDAKIGQTNATVQTVSQAQANLEGKASTMWSVKMQLNAQGQYVAAGIGLGIENGPAGLQSQFLVSADRFAVVNNINGTLSSPFVVQGGQVFINQALINTAYIQQIVLGMTLRSQAVNSQGQPLIELNMVTGAVAIRGQDASGSTLITNGQVNTYFTSGNPATKMGIGI